MIVLPLDPKTVLMSKLSSLIIPGIFMILFSFVFACQQNTTEQNTDEKQEATNIGEDRSMEPSNREGEPDLTFTHHVKNNARKAEIGEVVYYHYIMRTEHEMIRSSHTSGQLSYFQIPDPAKVSGPISPMLQGLMKMSLGDSLTVEQPLPEDAYRPEKHKDSNILYYDLSLREIKSMEEFQEDLKNTPQKHPFK